MVAIFTLFCIVFIDSGNKHKILNKMTWKLPVWASHFFPSLSHLLLGCGAAPLSHLMLTLFDTLCCLPIKSCRMINYENDSVNT